MNGILLGIEKRTNKEGREYLLFHCGLDSTSDNIVGQKVVTEFSSDYPSDLKVGMPIILEYEKNGKYFNTIISHKK